MKKEEFLKQLEYLLQDIPEDDKRDAIDYYGDYLEEAGPEREDEVLNEFGSPERIASIIRTDLLGGMETAGEFTDNGYDDQRFKMSEYPVMKNGKAQEKREQQRSGYESRGYSSRPNQEAGTGEYRRAAYENNYERQHSHYEKGSYASESRNRSTDESKWWKYFLIVLGILIIGPIAAGALFGAVGTAAGFIIVLMVMLLVLALLTVAGILGGIALIVTGVIQLLGSFWIGAMSIGLGLIFAGLGCLLFCCSWLFYGKFLPWAVMGIVRLVTGKKNVSQSQ